MRFKTVFLMAITAALASCTMRSPERQVEKVLSQMSVREKFAQLCMIAMDSRQNENAQALQDSLVREGLGGFIVMDDALLPNVRRMNHLQSLAKLPLMVAVDGEWGPSMRFSEFPFFPRQMQLGALRNEDLVYQMGRAVGEECRIANILINFAPVVDVNINPDNPVIGVRSFGEDKKKVAKMACAYMKGMQDAGIYACAKHFPGHGDTNVDSHRGLPQLDFTRERLDSVELFPFRELIDSGVALVMMGHLLILALDSEVSSVSRPIVTGLLKEELGFDGVVVTDGLGMRGVTAGRTSVEVNLAAYKAGVDILLMPRDVPATLDTLTHMLQTGELDSEELDNKVRKVLMLKQKAGMLERGYTAQTDTFMLKKRLVEASAADTLIQRISRESLTLVCCAEGALPAVPSAKAGAEPRPDVIPPAETGTELRPDALPSAGKKLAYLGYGATWQPRRFIGEGYNNGLAGFDPTSGVTREGTTVLGEILREKGVDVYYLPLETTAAELETMRRRLSVYDSVILGIHDGSSRPKAELIAESGHHDVFREWTASQPLSVVYFGTPYGLRTMDWSAKCSLFLIAYSDNVFNEKSAAEILSAECPALGVLPVSAGPYKCGFGIDTQK